MKVPQYRYQCAAQACTRLAPAHLSFLLAALLALCVCELHAAPSQPAFPDTPSGGLEITYPLDETLFPPDIVAPTFNWKDETAGVSQWQVLLRFDNEGDVLRFTAEATSWRPTEQDWEEIKQRSTANNAEMAIVGIGPQGNTASAATVRIRTSTDPVVDSIFYREVPLPFIEAVED